MAKILYQIFRFASRNRRTGETPGGEGVEESVKRQVEAVRNGDYGYGWWITDQKGAFAACRPGGQRILVWPSRNALLVMIWGGVDIDDIEPLLEPAFADLNRPLPANPAGMARLEAALAGEAEISPAHLAEAIQYRMMDRYYWVYWYMIFLRIKEMSLFKCVPFFSEKF